MSKIKFIGTWSLSKQLDIEHRSIKSIIDRYRTEFEVWGMIAVKVSKTKNVEGGANVKEYILNHHQANYLITLLWNSEKIRIAKRSLVKNLKNLNE